MNSIIHAPERRFTWGLLNDFDDFFRPIRSGELAERAVSPALDVSESDVDFVVKAELPGVGKDAIDVNIADSVLTIRAESKSDEDRSKAGRVIRRERRYGKYVRSLRLADNIDVANVSAEYTDGVLTLVLPKAESAKTKKIEVQVH